ncbi:hypothetical protein PCE1_003318 [Barthelona sp. PCE]
MDHTPSITGKVSVGKGALEAERIKNKQIKYYNKRLEVFLSSCISCVILAIIADYIISVWVKKRIQRLFPTVSRMGSSPHEFSQPEYTIMVIGFIIGYIGLCFLAHNFYCLLGEVLFDQQNINGVELEFVTFMGPYSTEQGFFVCMLKSARVWRGLLFIFEYVIGCGLGVFLPLIAIISMNVHEYMHQVAAWQYTIWLAIFCFAHVSLFHTLSLASQPYYLQSLTSHRSLNYKYVLVIVYLVFAVVYVTFTNGCNDNGVYCNTRSVAQYFLILSNVLLLASFQSEIYHLRQWKLRELNRKGCPKLIPLNYISENPFTST